MNDEDDFKSFWNLRSRDEPAVQSSAQKDETITEFWPHRRDLPEFVYYLQDSLGRAELFECVPISKHYGEMPGHRGKRHFWMLRIHRLMWSYDTSKTTPINPEQRRRIQANYIDTTLEDAFKRLEKWRNETLEGLQQDYVRYKEQRDKYIESMVSAESRTRKVEEYDFKTLLGLP